MSSGYYYIFNTIYVIENVNLIANVYLNLIAHLTKISQNFGKFNSKLLQPHTSWLQHKPESKSVGGEQITPQFQMGPSSPAWSQEPTRITTPNKEEQVPTIWNHPFSTV